MRPCSLSLSLFCLLLPLLLLGCPDVDDYEGDEGGECSDGGDNDRDGLFDCEDDGCAGSPECVGDDDDAVDDDDGVDDDDAVNDDDASDDDDGGGEAEIVESTSPMVVITAPNWGYDLATDAETITLEGVAREDVTGLVWTAGDGSTGSTDGLEAWVAADLPLLEGDNLLTVTAVNGDGDEEVAELLVVHNPGVPIVSDLTVGPSGAFAGEPVDVTAWLWIAELDGFEAGEVARVDEDGELVESLGALTADPDSEGRLEATFTLDEAAEADLLLRAFVTFDGETGSTPPVEFAVMTRPTEADYQALLDQADAIRAAFDAADPVGDPLGARDAALDEIANQPGIDAAGTSDDDGFGLWWITSDGVGFVLMANPTGTRGGGLPADRLELPRLDFPAYGPGAPRGWTDSAAGRSGREPTLGTRSISGSMTGDDSVAGLAPYNDEFTNDETAGVLGSLGMNLCPNFASATPLFGASANIAAFAGSLTKSHQVVSSHGDSFYGKAPKVKGWGTKNGKGQVAIATREAATAAAMTTHALDLKTGLVVVHPGATKYFYITPKFVKTKSGGKIPNAIVTYSACRSSWNNTLAAAFQSAGAAYFYGYTDYVWDDYAAARTNKFWEEIEDRNSSHEAFTEADNPHTPDDNSDPAYPKGWGKAVWAANGPLTNMGFEDGTTGWTMTTGNGAFAVDGQLPGFGTNVQAAEGSLFGYGQFQAAASTYAEFEHFVCPAPGIPVTLTFKWQVVTQAGSSCGAGLDTFITARIDRVEGNQVVWNQGWADYCPLLGPVGCCRGTGWQDATVTFDAPDTATPLQETLTFATGGWSYDNFYGLIDDVSIEQ